MHAVLVAAGILLSRVLGLVRESLKARYLGASGNIAADAFHAAFRIPNILQNLLGEGTLSASLIPVYAGELAKGNRQEADRIVGAVGALLALVAAILVLLGVAFAPLLVSAIVPGFQGERRELTILLTRILFPGAALFVFSAWCLGILNSHRRFFLSYASPVLWNLAIIAALLVFMDLPPVRLVLYLAWASVLGAALQFLVQLPTVLRVAPELRLWLGRGNEGVRRVARNFVPAFTARGVVQINAFVDQVIASFLPLGAVSLLFYTQTLTMLPISLFGMSVAAAELPAMSGVSGSGEEVARHVRDRLQSGLRRIAFLVIPSAVGFLMLGDTILAALYQHGRFTAQDTTFAWGILAGASLGLLASTLSRLYSSAFFALQDTRTPMRISIVRVILASLAGAFGALVVPGLLGVDARWGVVALTVASSLVAWLEFSLLRSRLNARIGVTGLSPRLAALLVAVALAAGAAAFLLKVTAGAGMHRVLAAALVLGLFGSLYLGISYGLKVGEAQALLRRVRGAGRGV